MVKYLILTSLVDLRALILKDLDNVGHLNLWHLPHVLGEGFTVALTILANLEIFYIGYITIFAYYNITLLAHFSFESILYDTMAFLAFDLVNELLHFIFIYVFVLHNILWVDEYSVIFLVLLLQGNPFKNIWVYFSVFEHLMDCL
jgi:hypothetical protein